MLYQKTFLNYLLLPFSLIFRFIIALRFFFYRHHIFKTTCLSVPVIIVGNISVGGTGKTPLVIALVKALQEKGFNPGIITRGYRGKNKAWPVMVDANSNPFLVGDEAVLLAQKTNVPVVAGPKRVDDAKLLLEKSSIDVIISDDGLQHYAIARDVEIAVIDESRQIKNHFLLPAGPLREPISRLKTVDSVVRNGIDMQFQLTDIVNLNDKNKVFENNPSKKIIAIAGMGNPSRFFETLKKNNIVCDTKIFPDHYAFEKKDISELKYDTILMTEKDAVKCKQFSDVRCYVVRGEAVVSPLLIATILTKIDLKKHS